MYGYFLLIYYHLAQSSNIYYLWYEFPVNRYLLFVKVSVFYN